jgi:SEC-C motif-containing protein
MSPRRAGRPPAPGRAADEDRCPCGSGEQYGACCGRFHRGQADAPTAEVLMRSRYAAFALGDAEYLLRTWHPTTRPRQLVLSDARRWVRLQVLGRTGGGLFDTEGAVSFAAHYVERGTTRRENPGVQSENSRFARVDGAWRYLDGRG